MKRESKKKAINGAAFHESADLSAGIAKRAYEIWMNEGCPHGCDLEHWLRAERELAGEPRPAAI